MDVLQADLSLQLKWTMQYTGSLDVLHEVQTVSVIKTMCWKYTKTENLTHKKIVLLGCYCTVCSFLNYFIESTAALSHAFCHLNLFKGE